MADCIEQMPMTLQEYEQVRTDPSHFAVVHGHNFDDIEIVVGHTDRYLIVEKLGAGRDRAVSLDDRSTDSDGEALAGPSDAGTGGM